MEPLEGLALVNQGLTLTNNITGFIAKFRGRKEYDRGQLEYIKEETRKLLIRARSNNAGEIFQVNMEELAKAQETIDLYSYQGRLKGRSLEMAYQQLEDLNRELRRNLEEYRDKRMR